MCGYVCGFFFKQKTAYEMRISDWSSDVCSSDLCGDLDALNHVNNTVYFRFFEEARVQLFSKVGLMPPSRKAGVVAHVSCDFLKPLMYPAMAVVTQGLVRVGRSSIEMETLLELEDEPGVFYAKGRYVMVGTDAEKGKSLDRKSTRLNSSQ